MQAEAALPVVEELLAVAAVEVVEEALLAAAAAAVQAGRGPTLALAVQRPVLDLDLDLDPDPDRPVLDQQQALREIEPLEPVWEQQLAEQLALWRLVELLSSPLQSLQSCEWIHHQ